MKNNVPTPTKESALLKAAKQQSGRTYDEIGAFVGVDGAAVRHWAEGIRPVPADRAPKLAEYLGIGDPTKISGKLALISKEVGNVIPMPADSNSDKRSHALAIRRAENDVDALRYALGGIFSAMAIHRPAEARDAANAIRKLAPKKYLERGFVHELLAILEPGEG